MIGIGWILSKAKSRKWIGWVYEAELNLYGDELLSFEVQSLIEVGLIDVEFRACLEKETEGQPK